MDELNEKNNERRLYDDTGVTLSVNGSKKNVVEALLNQKKADISEGIEKYMPVGSIISLNDSKIKRMIIGFNYVDGNKTFDYIGCTYPYGVDEEHKILFFNHEQIKSVYYIGYMNREEKAFKANLKEKHTINHLSKSIKPEENDLSR